MHTPNCSFRSRVLLAALAAAVSLLAAHAARADNVSLSIVFNYSSYLDIMQQPQGTTQQLDFKLVTADVNLYVNNKLIPYNTLFRSQPSWEFGPAGLFFQLGVSFVLTNDNMDIVSVDPLAFDGAMGNATNSGGFKGAANFDMTETDAYGQNIYNSPVSTTVHYIKDNGPDQYRTFGSGIL